MTQYLSEILKINPPWLTPGSYFLNFFEDFLHYRVNEGERHKGIKFNTKDDTWLNQYSCKVDKLLKTIFGSLKS